jgi:hypothetical protein
MFVRMTATGQLVDVPQSQGQAMVVGGTAELANVEQKTEREHKPRESSGARAESQRRNKPASADRAGRRVWLIVIGEILQSLSALAILAGLGLGWHHLRVEIPILSGILGLWVGRRLRKRGGADLPPRPRSVMETWTTQPRY